MFSLLESQDVTVQPNDPAKAGTQLHQMRATQMIGTPNDIKYGIYYIEPSAVSDYFTIDPSEYNPVKLWAYLIRPFGVHRVMFLNQVIFECSVTFCVHYSTMNQA